MWSITDIAFTFFVYNLGLAGIMFGTKEKSKITTENRIKEFIELSLSDKGDNVH